MLGSHALDLGSMPRTVVGLLHTFLTDGHYTNENHPETHGLVLLIARYVHNQLTGDIPRKSLILLNFIDI